MGRLAGRIWVTCTLLLISFIGFSSQLWIVLPSYHHVDLFSREVLQLLGPFNVLLALLYRNYYLCVVTEPGRVPAGWRPDEDSGMEVKKLTGGPRYCRTCRAYKPPRAHHCRQCNSCVLKMDHHCPWVNNCVGHSNYAHFIRFLIMVDLACSYHLWMISKRAFGAMAFASHPSTLQIVMLVLNYVACVPVLIAVGCFSLYHMWCLAVNTTTIESWEKEKVATLRRKGKIMAFRYPYHLGYLDNIKSVLGSNPLLWLVPTRKVVGDGLHHEVGKGVDPRSQYDWPPRDPYASAERSQARTARERSRARWEAASAEGGSPFNEGGLLASSSSTELRHRSRPIKANKSPWHDDYRPPGEEGSGSSSSSEESDADEEDIPLGELARLRADPSPAVRVRRGSEGYEVRPIGLGRPFEAVEEEYSDHSWEEGRISEGELDGEGDRMRRGPRYKRYERAESSGSDGEAGDGEADERNSVDEFLEEHTVVI